MSVNNYKDLKSHKGHEFECVTYGENISLECLTCNEVIISFDKED